MIAGFLTFKSMEQYQEMYRPPLSPPGCVFPVVWLILYALMGIAAYRIYMKDPKAEVLKLYLIQLAVNFLWPILFFNFGWQLFAVVWLLLLWYLVLAPLVSSLCKSYSQVTGLSSQPIASGGVTYARALPNCIPFGARFPHQRSQAHMPNESVMLGGSADGR